MPAASPGAGRRAAMRAAMFVADEAERCYAAALRILQHRWNSADELRRKLRSKKFEPDIVATCVARLTAEKWLDDDRFAGAFVRTLQLKGRGRVRIRRELSAAGVDKEVAAGALAANRDEDAERESITVLCTKRMAMIARRHGSGFVSSAEGRKKIAAYLLRQGYELALVLDVISSCITQAAAGPQNFGD